MSEAPNRSTAWPTQPLPTQTECTIIVPTYNERENIGILLSRIIEHSRFNVLVVDDNSPDGTAEVVTDLARHCERIRLLSRPGKQGLGTAYIAGFKQALASGARFIFEMDADFSHDPRYLPLLLSATETKYDVTVGSRYVRGGGTTDWGFIRQAISRGGNLYARVILGMPIKDCTGGFRCYRRSVLEHIDLDTIRSNGYAFQVEMLYQALCGGFRIGELPIIFPDRRVGASKMSHKIVIEALLTIWRLRFMSDHMNPKHTIGHYTD